MARISLDAQFLKVDIMKSKVWKLFEWGKQRPLEVVHLYKSTEKKVSKRINGLFMELSDQECDDGGDSDRRKRGGVKAVTGQDSRSHMDL